jgi:peptidoglycan/xylan/chitin deacetylase (PgdA/CDA1 family)
MPLRLALKVDVDTDRGTRLGVPNLVADCRAMGAPACFLFSLGPDQTGRAITRIFRPGFFQKVSRTSVVSMYGLRTLLNGTLLPAPHIGRRHADVMRAVRDAGFETGIHSYNHYRWQDHVQRMSLAEVRTEFAAARAEFRRIFGSEAPTAGAAGWQSNARSREVYDEAGLLYASDTRGGAPFLPRLDGRVFRTLEIPSTLPTFDELLGRPEYPDDRIVPHYLSLMREDTVNVLTIHAEIEGMGKRALFRALLRACADRGVQFVRLDEVARALLADRAALPVRDQVLASVDGRSGLVATQAAA